MADIRGREVHTKFGYIKVIDTMGDDAAVVQMARVSYGAGTKTKRSDRGLIRYLMRHWHTSPFEACEIKLLVSTTMDTWRQQVRHRTASINEYSTRYSEAVDGWQCYGPTEWRLQSTENKQGSGGKLGYDDGFQASELYNTASNKAREVYNDLLGMGVAREQARSVLPLSTFTEAYWKIDLHNLLHFLRLRMDSHAQLEIRTMANAIGDLVAEWVPDVWEAFLDYRLESVQFSRMEVEALQQMLRGHDPNYDGMSEREVKEFQEKING